MRWRKLGQVFCAEKCNEWAVSHAYVPTAFLLDGNVIRVYLAFLDGNHVGRIGFVDLDACDPLRILRISQKPALDIGLPGAFDDNGVTPMSLVTHDDALYLFYTGWQLGVRVRYFLFTGLAVSRDGGETFQRLTRAPVLDRADGELHVRTAAWVRPGLDGWRMWYVGGEGFISVGDKEVPTYTLRYAVSKDLRHWPEDGAEVLRFGSVDEHGFGRPCVLPRGDKYLMWYSIRTVSKGYRLGYAESLDGVSWTRLDDRIGIDLSSSGWDSEMMCFANVQDTRYGTYMFYNGNNYGETGFGVAVLEE